MTSCRRASIRGGDVSSLDSVRVYFRLVAFLLTAIACASEAQAQRVTRDIPYGTAHERQVLDRIGKLFEDVDCGPNGPEGNYRQRLYRLKTLVPETATAEEHEVEAFELAA